MYITDPVSDYFSQIRNAQMLNLSYTYIRNTDLSISILKALQQEGFIKGFSIQLSKNLIKVFLRDNKKSNTFKVLKRISKPSCRTYFSVKFLLSLNFKTGIFLLSTPLGILSHTQALKKGLSGEVLCFIL